jgi:DNA-directed RNA polymerase subunit RPC12/RpoP
MTLAKCAKCGETLIVSDDGMPFWCTECSYEEEYQRNQQKKRREILT